MKGILDRVSKSALSVSYSRFRPTNQLEYFALRLADKLGDSAATRYYAELAERHSEGPLLLAYRRAKASGTTSEVIRVFHAELQRLGGRHVNGITNHRLAAIRVDRRAVAVVILKGERLEYPPLVRQLPANEKALASIDPFLSWIWERCPFTAAALELTPHNVGDGQRHAMAQIVKQFLIRQAISIWEVPKKTVLASYGHPPLKYRNQVRDIGSSIWPQVNGSFGASLIHDALALGLYCQVEYLFNL